MVQILDQASDDLVKNRAMSSLAELKSAVAVETYASHLTDFSSSVLYNALRCVSFRDDVFIPAAEAIPLNHYRVTAPR